MKTTPENITLLRPYEVFVFGSNVAGRHGAGAARLAMQKFGAKWGQGVGLHGQSYAIPTKSTMMETLPINVINWYVEDFLEFATNNPASEFLVTKIGCGLAGLDPCHIAPLFNAKPLPRNVWLPKEFQINQPEYAANK